MKKSKQIYLINKRGQATFFINEITFFLDAAG